MVFPHVHVGGLLCVAWSLSCVADVVDEQQEMQIQESVGVQIGW